MRRVSFLCLLLLLLPALLVSMETSASLVIDSGANSAVGTLHVGAYPSRSSSNSASATFQVTVRNTGSGSLWVTSISTSPNSGSVYFYCSSNCNPTISSGSSTAVTFFAYASNSAPTGTTSGSYTIFWSNGTISGSVAGTVSIPVRLWLAPTLSGVTSPTVAAAMPCPKPSGNVNFDFSISMSNTGDHPLTVYSVSFSGFPYSVESLAGFGGFSVNAGSTVSRSYRVSLSSSTAEGTTSGSAYIDTDSNDQTTTVRVSVTQPVNVDLPAAPSTPHDFGNVSLLSNPPSWTIRARETCGYKAAIVQVDAPSTLPDFVLPSTTRLNLSAGQGADFSVRVHFASRHHRLLYQPQPFDVRLTTSTGGAATYAFRALPVFIDVDEQKARLEQARRNSTFPDAQEAAQRILDVLVDRTEVRPPRTEAEIQDAARIVSLVEPTALVVEQFDAMAAWNAAGRQDDTVHALVAVAGAQHTLRAACNEVTESPLRAQCQPALDLLVARASAFAQNATDHFANLTALGRTDLERERAAAGLGLALGALGRQAEADQQQVLAEIHFASFTRRLARAENLTAAIPEREAGYAPWAFTATGGRFLIWNPLGAVLLGRHATETRQDYAEAGAELAAAGDTVRLAEVEREQAAFEAALGDSRWSNLLVLAAYGIGALAAAAWSVEAWRRRRGDLRMRALGDLLLPERSGRRRAPR